MKNYPYICGVKLLKREIMEQLFKPTRVITPDAMPIPKEGTVGYVHIENVDYEGPEIEPKFFDVDSYEVEIVG